jgi:hypothetical protein
MENLSKLDLVELNQTEMKEVEGGNVIRFIYTAISTLAKLTHMGNYTGSSADRPLVEQDNTRTQLPLQH